MRRRGGEETRPDELSSRTVTIDLSRINASQYYDGLKHPVTFFEGDGDRNAALWNALHALIGCNEVARIKADACA